jgi:hypothetical protein
MTTGLIPKDIVSTPPTKDGPYSRAWLGDIDAWYAQRNAKREDGGDIASWLVEAPWAHPMWHSYWICLLHLRPTPDGRPTKFYVDGATHELWLYALDPDQPRQTMLDTGQFKLLLPTNFAAQFIEPDDEAAKARVAETVRLICIGTLSPDTDFIRQWAALFGDNMLKDRG